MLYGKLIDALIPSLKNTASDTAGRTIAGRYINLAVKELYLAHQWPYRKKSGSLLLIPNYVTGTCSVTQFTGANEAQARIVTFGGATLAASMQGRFFQLQDSSDWHKIISVDTVNGQIVLDTPVLEASASGKTFKIWKRFYYLPSEVVSVLTFGKWGTGKIDFEGSSIMQRESTDISREGAPYQFSDYGIDPYEGIYSAGTIGIAANSNIVTGLATSFLGNADSGDILIVNQVDYRIKRVETDLQIILYNYIGDTEVKASSYSIKKESPLGFQFYFNADKYRIIPYDYLARTYDMLNESMERPPVPEDFDKAILSRAESLFLKDKDDPKWTSVLALYQAELEGKKISNEAVLPTFFKFHPAIPSGMRNR